MRSRKEKKICFKNASVLLNHRSVCQSVLFHLVSSQFLVDMRRLRTSCWERCHNKGAAMRLMQEARVNHRNLLNVRQFSSRNLWGVTIPSTLKWRDNAAITLKKTQVEVNLIRSLALLGKSPAVNFHLWQKKKMLKWNNKRLHGFKRTFKPICNPLHYY